MVVYKRRSRQQAGTRASSQDVGYALDFKGKEESWRSFKLKGNTILFTIIKITSNKSTFHSCGVS